jgi:hypothetical protein
MSSKHIIQQDKADEVKALVARYVLLKIEQKKIEAKLSEITRFYDEESLRTIFEPIGDSMMGIIGLELPRKKEHAPPKVEQESKQQEQQQH